METNGIMIQVTSGEQIVETMKLYVGEMLSGFYDCLLELDLPKLEDFQTKEEYEEACKKMMIELVEDVTDIKEEVFKNVLNTYNDFLTGKVEFEQASNKEKQALQSSIVRMNVDMKTTGIVTLTLTLLFPGAMPILLMINIPRIGMDLLIRNKNQAKINRIEFLKKEMKKIQDPFYELTDALRSDYHKSKKELEEIKQKAIEGNNVVQDLLPIIDPERISLPRVHMLTIIRNMTSEEGPKELKKRIEE